MYRTARAADRAGIVFLAHSIGGGLGAATGSDIRQLNVIRNRRINRAPKALFSRGKADRAAVGDLAGIPIRGRGLA